MERRVRRASTRRSTTQSPVRVVRRRRRRRSKAVWFWRIGLCALLLFLIAGIGEVSYLCVKSKTFRNVVTSKLSGDWQPSKAFPGRDQVTLLVMGRDVNYDHRGRVLKKCNARSDAMLLVRLDFANKTANVLSIPRDTIVDIPGYGRHKINEAHANGGPELAVETVNNFLGVQPDYYLTFDYDAFIKTVDLMGGLDVNVPKQLDYDDNVGGLHIHLRPGQQQLTGYQAMGFVRYRKSKTGVADSDFERIGRQHQFMMAVKDKMKSAQMFVKLPDVIETVRAGVNSPLSDSQMMAVANFVKNLPKESVHMATLPDMNRKSDEDAVVAEAEKMIQDMFKS